MKTAATDFWENEIAKVRANMRTAPKVRKVWIDDDGEEMVIERSRNDWLAIGMDVCRELGAARFDAIRASRTDSK